MQLQGLSAVAIVEALIKHAEDIRASDIHVDPREKIVVVRMRVDGDLKEVAEYSHGLHVQVIARLKVLSGLRLDEHTIPQDGRFSFSQVCDVRIVITPSYFGQAAVLRLLRPYDKETTLSSLGFAEKDITCIEEHMHRRSGMILVAGPTGSGKTTTLYTLLQHMLEPHIATVTIEDPIEYIVPKARQIPVRNEKLPFARVLRSVLRQDPNVIMVGEIRDGETAQVASAAALTGHLVLSTIHTKSAAATRARLEHMGVELYIRDATLSLVIAQRLVGCICKLCAEEYIPSESELVFIDTHSQLPVRTLYRGVGCENCNYRGYKGRVAVYEIDDGQKKGTRTLIEDGIQKASAGIISLEHVMALI